MIASPAARARRSISDFNRRCDALEAIDELLAIVVEAERSGVRWAHLGGGRHVRPSAGRWYFTAARKRALRLVGRAERRMYAAVEAEMEARRAGRVQVSALSACT